MTLADLKRAAELLPCGSSITVTRDALLAAFQDCEPIITARPDVDVGPGRLLTVRDVAARMGISRKHVYARANAWPFTRRIGPKGLRFEERGLERWLARQH